MGTGQGPEAEDSIKEQGQAVQFFLKSTSLGHWYLSKSPLRSVIPSTGDYS